MTHFWLFACFALLLTVPTVPRAQSPTPNAPAAKSADKQTMYEDIEIMRRILNKQVGSVQVSVQDPTSFWYEYDGFSRRVEPVPGTQFQRYSSSVDPAGVWLAPNVANTIYAARLGDTYYWSADSNHGKLNWITREGSNFDGAYLKGHGVVYTGSVPAASVAGLESPPRSLGLVSLCSSCHDAASIRKLVEPASEAAREEPTLWEKVRREVRGAKDEPAPKPPERVLRQDICTPGALAERILETLAQNGHNFRALPANEGISVIVTVPGLGAQAAPAAQRKEKGEASTAVRTAKQLLDLADLHTKQGKNDEAAKTLADAIKRLADQPLSYPQDTPYDTVAKEFLEAKQLLRTAYTKQAQLLLAAGKLKEAREALDKAENAGVVVNGQENPTGASSAEKSPPALPAKLVVTVSKKLLDEAHAGKIDVPGFKKGAEVEAIGFPAAAKGKAPAPK